MHSLMVIWHETGKGGYLEAIGPTHARATFPYGNLHFSFKHLTMGNASKSHPRIFIVEDNVARHDFFELCLKVVDEGLR